MAEEEDFGQRPLLERWKMPQWKARVSAYHEAGKMFDDVLEGTKTLDTLTPFLEDPQLLKKAVTETNAPALEAGVQMLDMFLKVAPAPSVDQLRALALPNLLEKGLASVKTTVKKATIDVVLDFVAGGNPANVLTDVISQFSVRNPKALATAVSAAVQIFTQFGSPVTDPSPVLAKLPVLFGHADKTVRSEALELAAAVSSWIGSKRVLAALSDIKPVQLKEVTAKLAENNKVVPQRYTRAQEAAQAAKAESQDAQNQSIDADRTAEDLSAGSEDEWTLLPEQQVLSRLPLGFEKELASTKWKERKEVLEAVESVLKVDRMASGDYLELVNVLVRVLSKDTNQQVAGLAVQCVNHLATGLRHEFAPFASLVVPPLTERYKEKRAQFVAEVSAALLAVLKASSLTAVLPGLLDATSNRTPAVKIEAARFLGSELRNLTQTPTQEQIDGLGAAGARLLNESQEPMRQAGAEILGTLLKACGAGAVAKSMSGLDDLRKAKVQRAAEEIQVKMRAAKEPQRARSIRPEQRKAQTKPNARAPPEIPLPAVAPSKKPQTAASRQIRTTAAGRAPPLPKLQAVATPSKVPAATPMKKNGARTFNLSSITPTQPPPIRRRLGASTDSGLKSPSLPSQPPPGDDAAECARLRSALQSSERICDSLRERVSKLEARVEELEAVLMAKDAQNGGEANDLNGHFEELHISQKDRIAENVRAPSTPTFAREMLQRSNSSEESYMRRKQEYEDIEGRWKRCVAVTSDLKRRLAEMKRERELSRSSSNASNFSESSREHELRKQLELERQRQAQRLAQLNAERARLEHL